MASTPRLREFTGSANSENVSHWLRHVDLLGMTSGWSNEHKLAVAMSALRGPAAYWLDSKYGTFNQWDEFVRLMTDRFGEPPAHILQQIINRKQGTKETVHNFADAFQQLLSRAANTGNAMPDNWQKRAFILGLAPHLRVKLMDRDPQTLEQAVRDAQYFEEVYATPEYYDVVAEPWKATENTAPLPQNGPRRHNGGNGPRNSPQVPQPPIATVDPLEEITRKLDKLQIQMNDLNKPAYNRSNYYPPNSNNRPRFDRYPQPREDRPTIRSVQFANPEADLEEDPLNFGFSTDTEPLDEYPESQEELEEYSSDYEELPVPERRQVNNSATTYLPSYFNRHHRQYAYNNDVEMEDIADRRPRARVGFNPATLPRPNVPPVPGGSAIRPPQQPRPSRGAAAAGTRQNPPQLPQQPPVRRPPPNTPSHRSFNFLDQLKALPVKISCSDLLKISPMVRREVKEYVQAIDITPNLQGNLNKYIPPAKRNKQNQSNHQARIFESHSPSPAPVTSISVVKAPVRIRGQEISAIIDSGASHSLMTERLARKLQLYRHIEPCTAKFYTSSGALEKPLGYIKDVPVQIGSLILDINIYVSRAGNYSILIGNDLLVAAEAQLNYADKLLWIRKDLDSMEAVPIDFEGQDDTIVIAEIQDKPQEPQELPIISIPKDPRLNQVSLMAAEKPQFLQIHPKLAAIYDSDRGFSMKDPHRQNRSIIFHILDASQLQEFLAANKSALQEPKDDSSPAYDSDFCTSEPVPYIVVPFVPWIKTLPTFLQYTWVRDYFAPASRIFIDANTGIPIQSTLPMAVLLPNWEFMRDADSTHNWEYPYLADLPALKPEPIVDCPSIPFGNNLNDAQQADLQSVIQDNKSALATTETDRGLTTIPAANLNTGNHAPIKQCPYQFPPKQNDIIQQQIQEWLDQGIIVPSKSPWSSPVVLVSKKKLNDQDPDEKPRFRLCVDYRKLNKVTKTDAFPLPMIQDALDQVGPSQWFSIIDLKSAFLQVPLSPEDQEKTAFVTKNGQYQFTVLPFGLKNSPAIFQRLMTNVLGDYLDKFCLVFIDDILVFSETWQAHVAHLHMVFSRLTEFGLKAHPDKCKLGTQEVKYLGHVLTPSGNFPQEDKLQAVQQLQPPQTLTELRAFLGLTSYYRRFVQGYSHLAAPLTSLLRKDTDFVWSTPCQQAFQELKNRLVSPPILRRPDFSKPFILQTDYSQLGFGAVLSQEIDVYNPTHTGLTTAAWSPTGKSRPTTVIHPVAYASKACNSHEQILSATEGEAAALLWAVSHFHYYLACNRFTLITDHQALKWILTGSTAKSGKLARWSLKLQEYDFDIQYKPGSSNNNADALSRFVASQQSTLNSHPDNQELQFESSPSSPEPELIHVNLFLFEEQRSRSPFQLRRGDEPGTIATGTPHNEVEENRLPTGSPDINNEITAEALTAPGKLEDTIPSDLSCSVCQRADGEESMLLCDCCNLGFHTHCLEPPLMAIPSEPWFCGNCGGDAQANLGRDITGDKEVLHYLQHGTLPLGKTAVQKKRISKRAKNYVYDRENQQLYRRSTPHHEIRRVPKPTERPKIIEQMHGLGHFGIMRTASLVQERYYWGGIYQQVKSHISNCHVCKLQNAKFSKPPELITVPVPDQMFQKIGIDILGPLPESRSGNRYAIVAMDYLSKWPEVAPLPNKTAKLVADFFFRDIVCRYGCPREVVSDNGGEFKGEFEQLLQECSIDHRLTAPNHPQANGLVERYNATLATALRKMVGSKPKEWDEWIPTVLLGYRSGRHSTTQLPPIHFILGRRTTLPGELQGNRCLYGDSPINTSNALQYSGESESSDESESAQHLTRRVNQLGKFIPKALSNIENAQARQKQNYLKKRKYVQTELQEIESDSLGFLDTGKKQNPPISITLRPPTASKSHNFKQGDYVIIKNAKRNSKLEFKAGPEIFKIAEVQAGVGRNIVLIDNSEPPRKWKENPANLAPYLEATAGYDPVTPTLDPSRGEIEDDEPLVKRRRRSNVRLEEM